MRGGVRRLAVAFRRDVHVREDVLRAEGLAALADDVDGARVAGIVADVQVLAVFVAADAGLGAAATGEDDAVAFLRVEVEDFARFVPAAGVMAVKQIREGIRPRAAFEQRRTVSGDEDVIACATVQRVRAVLLCGGKQFGAVFAEVVQ